MKLSQYFQPVSFSKIGIKEGESGKYSTGLVIKKTDGDFPGDHIAKFDIVLFGVPIDNGSSSGPSAKAPDKIREKLYRLPFPDKNLKIIDLGNLKTGKNQRDNLQKLQDVIGYFIELNVVSVVIGGSQELTSGICLAFKNKKYFTLSSADALLDVKKGSEKFCSSNYLTRIFRTFPGIFQFSLLAYQSHLVAPQLFKKNKGLNRHLRLGLLREQISEAEPILRNSNVFSFDFGAIKNTDAPGNKQENPNGLHSEEACQLAKYAGASERLKVFGLFEVVPGKDKTAISTKLAAEMIWYFAEAVGRRQKVDEWNVAVNKTQFKVELNELDKPIVFFHELSTDRWWFEVVSLSGNRLLVACSEKEYRQATQNEIPEMWLKYVQKIDETSK